MTVYNIEALTPSPDPAVTLKILSDAIGRGIVPSSRRVLATEDSRSPDEGLALLNAYVSLRDRKVRQAILDAVLTIAEADPLR